MKLHTIETGFFKLDGGAMFGVVPKGMWVKMHAPDANNMCTWAMRCLLIEDGKQLILIDCGMGYKQGEKFFGRYDRHGDDTLEKSLAALGYHTDDITDMILSHLHFDHCGGAIRREGDKLVPNFKNATYWSNEKHWEWAVKPNQREKASFLKENILPIQESGQLKFINDGSREINPNVLIRTVSGHTESMFTPHITYKGHTIVYCADLIPSRWHIPIPYVMAYDTRPLLTFDEKEKLMPEAAAGDYLFYFEHDPTVEMVSIQNTDRGVREKEHLRLIDL